MDHLELLLFSIPRTKHRRYVAAGSSAAGGNAGRHVGGIGIGRRPERAKNDKTGGNGHKLCYNKV